MLELSQLESAQEQQSSPVKGPAEVKPLQLTRCVSEANLSERITSAPQPVSQFLLDALEAHRLHQEEQDAIQRQMEALMTKARERREEFRKAWGVSPKSINRKRTIKTVIIQPMQVQFSPSKNKREEEEEAATATGCEDALLLQGEVLQEADDDVHYDEQEMDMTGTRNYSGNIFLARSKCVIL